MDIRQQMADDIEQDNNDSNEERAEVDQIDVDMGSMPFVKFTPTTMPTGTFPSEDEGNPVIRFPDKENKGRSDQGYVGLVLDDVGAVTDSDEDLDSTIVLETEDDSTEYRVFDLDDEDTKRLDDVGIKYGDRVYEGEEVDPGQFADRAIVIVDRLASFSVARRLDVNGAEYADMDPDTGEPNGGLIEYAPSDVDSDVDRRYARPIVELRDELYETQVGIVVSWRSNIDNGATGYVGDVDTDEVDVDNLEAVVGVANDGRKHSDEDRATFEELVEADERRDMMWYSLFNMDTGDIIQPTTGDPTLRSYLEWRFDAEVGRLPDDDWDFVESYLNEDLPTDEDTIRENVEKNKDKLSEDPNVTRIVNEIQSRA